VAGQLSQLLPHLIDRVTPNGKVPESDIGHTELASALAGILGQSKAS